MPVFPDQTGKALFLPGIPTRIVSVVPSQTELLHALGLDEEVVAITKFCVHPAQWFRQKPKVGGTKSLDRILIDQISPDLIIANKEENTKEQIEELARQYPVWTSDISDLPAAFDMIEKIGQMTGRIEKAKEIISSIQSQFRSMSLPEQRLKTAYLIWHRPLMTIGRDTFIHSMLEKAGFENVFKDCLRYPAITLEQLQAKNPDTILLSSEPFPFKDKHVEELRISIPGSRIILVDGEMFSWYGSRLIESPSYFQRLRNNLR